MAEKYSYETLHVVNLTIMYKLLWWLGI